MSGRRENPGEIDGTLAGDAPHRSTAGRLWSPLRRLDGALPISVKLAFPLPFIAVAGGGILGFTATVPRPTVSVPTSRHARFG